jgi:APA family basic amino acid/polyamine antiporter
MAEHQLKRGLNLPLLIFYGVGTVLGSGVYILTGKIAGEAGMYAPISFIIAAIIAGLTGFSYAELSSRMPESAGEVAYLKKAFNRNWLAGLIGYLLIFTAILSTATMARGFVGYLHVFVELPPSLVIILVTLVLGGIALWGITQSAWLIMIITILEVLGIVFFIGVTGHHLGDIPERAHELMPPLEFTAWAGIMGGAFLAFFTFIGFEDLVNEAEEAKNPRRNLPIAIIFTMIMLTVIYLLVALLAVLAMPPEELATDKAPLSTILGQYHSSFPFILSFISLISSLNGGLVQTVMGSRILYGMSKKKMAPEFFKAVHPKTKTPIKATLPIIAFIILLALLGNIGGLAALTDYVIITVFALVNLSLFSIKLRKTDPVASFRVPIWVPLLGFVLCTGFLIMFSYLELMGH